MRDPDTIPSSLPSEIDPTDLLTQEEREYFTVVFRGDISKLPFNVFKSETVFGEVVASGYGHAFREMERLEDQGDPAS